MPDVVKIVDIDAFVQESESLISSCRQTLWAYAHSLEPRVFANADVIKTITKVVTKNRRADVRLLVRDIHPVIKYDHPLVELSQKLSSFIEIRVLPDSFQEKDELILLVDALSWLRLEPASNYQGRLSQNDPTTCKELKIRYSRMWEESSRPTDVLRLHL